MGNHAHKNGHKGHKISWQFIFHNSRYWLLFFRLLYVSDIKAIGRSKFLRNMYKITYALVIFLLTILIVYFALYIWRRRHWYLAARQFNGPLSLPIIGNAWLFICNNEEILMRIYNVFKKYNEPVRFWLGPMLTIFLRNPEHVEKILTSSKFSTKHDIYRFAKIYLGEGLITGDGPAYKQHRRAIQPMFDLNFANECIPIFQKHMDLCMKKLNDYTQEGTFDIGNVIHECIIDVFKEITLGSDERSQLNGLSEFDEATRDGYELAFLRMIKPYLQPNILFNMTSGKKQQDKYTRIIKNYGDRIIENSHKRRKSSNTFNEIYPIVDKIADLMEANPNIISDNIFWDHVLTVYVASEDPIPITFGFLCMCFGMYPEYQEKAAKEVRDIFGDTPRSVTLEDINRLNYVDMCIKEVWRLFPIGPIILRKCTGDFQLEKWLIPKDCAIGIPIFNLHRDERYWEKPLDFHPDHFLPEVANNRHTFAYLPFSAGPRGCIGKILANTALKILVCNLLQRFQIEADGKLADLELKMDISVRPVHGYNVKLKKRVWK